MITLFRLLSFLAVTCVFTPIHGLCADSAFPRQIILVISGSWSDTNAKLFRFEKSANRWNKVGDAVKVVVGENGMGWGVGSEGEEKGIPLKKEGDKRAPAGVFPLLKAMGYAAGSFFTGAFPYEQITEETHCVDDPASSYYNRIVKESQFHEPVAGLWKSSEHMLLQDDRYKKLVVVGYNGPRPQPGAGSCIFMHIWRSPVSPTMGCTAMAEGDLDGIMRWLSAEGEPSLVQLPLPVYSKRWQELGLPAPDMLTDP